MIEGLGEKNLREFVASGGELIFNFALRRQLLHFEAIHLAGEEKSAGDALPVGLGHSPVLITNARMDLKKATALSI